MAKKKLTKKLKEQIKSSPFRVKQEDFAGEALAYLKRRRKARKKVLADENSTLIIAGHEVPEDSETYKKISAAAATQHMTVKKFVSKYKKETEKFVKNDRFYADREIDYLKNDITKLAKAKRKFFIKGKEVTAAQLKYRVGRLKSKMINTLDIYNTIIIEGYYDGENNLHMDLPDISDFADTDDPDELEDFLETHYDGIIKFYNNGTGTKNKKQKPNAKKQRK